MFACKHVLLLSSLFCLFTSAIPPSIPALPSMLLPRATAPPEKRAIAPTIVGSGTVFGRYTTSTCNVGSTFTMSSPFAGCVGAGEQIATACAPNSQSKQSTIVSQSLWCTKFCFSSNHIYTSEMALPLTEMNCVGGFPFARYEDTTTTTEPRSFPTEPRDATTNSDTPKGTDGIDVDNAQPQGGNNLSKGDIAGIVVGVVFGLFTAVGTIFAVRTFYRNRENERSVGHQSQNIFLMNHNHDSR